MNWHNIRLIFLREVRDQLRDRRTLFMVAVLPLLLYPVLGIAMMQMLTTYHEETRTVVVLGAADLPDPPLIENGRFVPRYFEVPEDADKLRVVTDANPPPDLDPDLVEFLRAAREMRPKIEEMARVTEQIEELGKQPESPANAAALQALEDRQYALRDEIGNWFNRSPVQVLIVVPANYRERITELNAWLVDRSRPLSDLTKAPHPVLMENAAMDKSAIASSRVREAVRNWEKELLELRLEQAQLPQSLHTPFDATNVDLAQDDQFAASVWSKLFPTLLVIMAVTGAFYPAIDVGAGEKERGTMETLLICPATRTEIVTGKFLTVMLFSLATALLNLLSMGFTSKYMLEVSGGSSNIATFNVSAPPTSALIWLVVLAVPVAALFSALSLAFAMFARSSKEGQYYLTPLLMVSIGLTLFCLNPGVEINPYHSLLPVVGPALLLKALLLGSTSAGPLSVYFTNVLVSSFAYSALALWWGIDLFRREDILFREAERFDLRLWLRHILRDKEPTPGFTEAGFCFVLILVLQFASYKVMNDEYSAAPPSERAVRLLELQMIYLLVTVATPALMMAVVLTTDFRRTLKLNLPRPSMLGLGIALPFLLLPISQELMHSLEGWFFPALPEDVGRAIGGMSDRGIGLWRPLLAFAVAPALCEELAFRGFILSGMQRSGRRWLPIIMSSVAFGIVHVISQQVFNAILLGLVLGLLAVRSRSLVPCIVFHFLFNGVQVLLSRSDLAAFEHESLEWLFTVERAGAQSQLRFDWPLLLICGVAAMGLIRWLVVKDAPSPAEARPVEAPQEWPSREVGRDTVHV
jgi:sodium transport system permease protein